MPEISRFFGIIVIMNYNDHNPPHFHAIYGEQEVSVDIQTGIVKGIMSKRSLAMIFEWYEKYKDELMKDWQLSKSREPLKKIPPLE